MPKIQLMQIARRIRKELNGGGPLLNHATVA
jgi:hypothetical protein